MTDEYAPWQQVQRYIWHLPRDYQEYEKGYYFSDEVEQLHGPFDTIEETKRIFTQYIDHLDPKGE